MRPESLEEFGALEEPKEQQAAMALLAMAMSLRLAAAAPACEITPAQLRDFATGNLEPARALEVLSHLSACPQCRRRERAIAERARTGLLLTCRLPAIRPMRDVIRDEWRAWFGGLVLPFRSADPFEASVIADGAEGRSVVLAGPAVVDRRGRLEMELDIAADDPGTRLLVAVQDSERRLELSMITAAAPSAHLIVDCSPLSPPAGFIPPNALAIAFLNEESARNWALNPVLGPLQRLIRELLNPIDFADALGGLISTHSEVWPDVLRAEIAAAPSREEGIGVIKAALDRLTEYATLWSAANAGEDPLCASVRAALANLLDTSQETTVKPARSKRTMKRLEPLEN
jgi:hypothetical protein